jgi:PII-like signaling protein
MNGFHLRFYTCENRRHHGRAVHEWLLEQARRIGIHGGSAFRAMAGFGRHGRLHEQRFFELAGEVPVLVEFIASEAEADALLELLRSEGLDLFYACIPTRYGWISDRGDAPVR